jgi:hypothetical protein
MTGRSGKAISDEDRESFRALLVELENLQARHSREVRYVALKAGDSELEQALIDGLNASHHHRLVPYLQKVLALKQRSGR